MEKASTGGVFLQKQHYVGLILSGIGAGAVNGLFGAGGGMVLVPLLSRWGGLEEREVFPASVCIILPMSIVSLMLSWQAGTVSADMALPYLLGSAAGGVLAGFLGKRIPTLWFHRFLGALIIWGGIRYLC